MSETRVSTRYARSFLEYGQANNNLETLYQDAQYFIDLCRQSRDFQVMLENPIIPQGKKNSVVDKVLGDDINAITKNFIKLVIKKQRSGLLTSIFSRLISLYKDQQGITPARVYSTINLPDNIIEQIKQIVDKQNPEKVELENQIQEDLIGGFVLRYEDKLLDKSIASQLKQLNKVLKN